MSRRMQIGRLALRQEGDYWNAYYAMPDTMTGAVRLGSIAMGFIVSRPERKDAFIALMREAVADIVEAKSGTRPTWSDDLRSAPEHERAGCA